MKSFEGRWQLSESTNYDEFLTAMGVSTPIREALRHEKPTMEVTIDSNQRISFVTITMLKKVEVVFNLDMDFEETLLDGTKFRGRAEKNGDKFISTTSSADGAKQLRVTRELNGDEIILTLEALQKGIKAIRKYKRM